MMPKKTVSATLLSVIVSACLLMMLTACTTATHALATVTPAPTFTATVFPTFTATTTTLASTATTTAIAPPTRVPVATATTISALANTPPYTTFQPLLKEKVAAGPVYVTADQAPAVALITAGNTLTLMLQHRPDIAVTLRSAGTFTVVASQSEQICSLSYFANIDSTTCAAYGYGGAGGITGHPITACNERNLLKEANDPYLRGASTLGQNICVHELAHTIMNVGLSQPDLDAIYARFQAVQATSLWTGDYAMTNVMEFWAVMSQFYFSAGPNATYSAFHHIANGPAALKHYDPQTFALLDSIYRGATDLS